MNGDIILYDAVESL